MVIQCTQCNTRFKIADEKLKPGGIKVRCSKCRNIFTVMPPEPEIQPPSREDEVDFGSFNMEPVPEEPKTAPEADLTGRGRPEDADSAFAAPPSESTEIPGEAEESPAQEGPTEFDFEEEPPSQTSPEKFDSEEEPSIQKGSVEFDFEEETSFQKGPTEFDFEEEVPTQQGPVEFDFEEETTEEEGPVEFGFEEEPGGSAEFSFEETDPFSADSQTEEGRDTEKGAGAPEDFVFGSETDENAEIDDFDLSGMNFGDEDAAAEEEDVRSIPMEQQSPEIHEKMGLPAQPKSREPAVPAAVPRRKSPFKGLLIFVLILLLALCGVAGYFFWQRGDLDIVKIVEKFTGQGTQSDIAGQIRLSELSSSFVTNREAGQLFVIQGKATNDYPEARSAIAVKGILYDKKGQPLLQQTVFCGNTMDLEGLRSMPFAKIEESMNNQFGDSLSNLNVAPGKSIPFTIVFKNLPPDLAEYTVEAVDSKPGSKP